MDVLNATLAALGEVGLAPAPADASRIRTDGTLARFDAEGDKPGKRNAWCVVMPGPRPVAAFGHWSRGVRETRVLGDAGPLTLAERERQRQAILQAREARAVAVEREQRATQQHAQAQWAVAIPATAVHPYLLTKGITAAGARQDLGYLLIPLRDDVGNLWNLQWIRADGQKRFLAGGRVKGCYGCIGGPVRDHLIICEGWATGKSIHASTGLPVAVAFSAGNLATVARIMRAKYPGVRITVAADNDIKADGTNPGVSAATLAARVVGGYLAVPPVAGDFNDLAAQSGASASDEVTSHVPH